jgi:hypothetical protein
MRKVQIVNEVHNRYFIGESTRGSTSDIYLSDGATTIKLEDCLIWEDSEFTDEEFYSIVEDCKMDAEEMREMGWTIVEEQV